VGLTDLKAPTEAETVGVGPIAQALEARTFDEAVVLSDASEKTITPYLSWLRARSKTPIDLFPAKLTGPTEYAEIHECAVRAVEHALAKAPKDTALSFHLSPGTPAMGAVWLLLGKTRFPAELIESSRQHGVRTVNLPFEISVDFIPDLLRERDERLRRESAAESPESPEFSDIVYRSRVMQRLIERARRVALHNVPVLIEGESGTGKEMLARAIHRASPRRDKAFVPVNCGAIPSELVESELFGHEKGAFTGATQARMGHFETAHGGTLFLDELGELPAPVQVKLLRTLQEGEIVRVGASKPITVDVRVVAATHRTLTDEIVAGRFREDLFYRLAVAILKLPPLRERAGDIGPLIDHCLAKVNQDAAVASGLPHKKLSAGARNLLTGHPWKGNVRELLNTLRRAAIWCDGVAISSEDIREALLPTVGLPTQEILNRPLGGGLNLADLLKSVARHYLGRAIDEAHGNKTKAAELVGLPSYQTLSNWLEKYEVET
jgi:transcriptional regulator with PAS, ATPase and Fis domain